MNVGRQVPRREDVVDHVGLLWLISLHKRIGPRISSQCVLRCQIADLRKILCRSENRSKENSDIASMSLER